MVNWRLANFNKCIESTLTKILLCFLPWLALLKCWHQFVIWCSFFGFLVMMLQQHSIVAWQRSESVNFLNFTVKSVPSTNVVPPSNLCAHWITFHLISSITVGISSFTSIFLFGCIGVSSVLVFVSLHLLSSFILGASSYWNDLQTVEINLVPMKTSYNWKASYT